jgi:uncharacterized damage-inducible protein DinB
MDWVPFITQGFDYDRWANRQWLNNLGGFKRIERAHQILEHILQAQQIWLKRCDVEIPRQEDDISLHELFDSTAMMWIMVLEQTDPDEVISYANLSGQRFAQPIAQIALHVINHGTYHRGQLRGLAEADGYTTFPETDLIFFLREHSTATPPSPPSKSQSLYD